MKCAQVDIHKPNRQYDIKFCQSILYIYILHESGYNSYPIRTMTKDKNNE